MASTISDLVVEEISLVDDPANEQARVQIVKRRRPRAAAVAYGKTPGKDDLAAQKSEDGMTDDGMVDGEDATDEEDLMSKAARSIAAVVTQTLAGGHPDADAADTAAAALQEHTMDLEALSKSLETAEAKLRELSARVDEAEEAVETANETIAARDAEIAALQKAAKSAPAAKADAEEDVLKSLPEAIRKRIEENERIAKDASEKLAKMAAEREEAEAIAKARSLTIGKAEEIGPLLLRVAKGTTTTDDAKALEALLKAASEQTASSGLFKAFGSPVAVDGDPEELLKAKAQEIATRTKVSFEAAYAKALDENPALYSAYIAKRRA